MLRSLLSHKVLFDSQAELARFDRMGVRVTDKTVTYNSPLKERLVLRPTPQQTAAASAAMGIINSRTTLKEQAARYPHQENVSTWDFPESSGGREWYRRARAGIL